MTLTLDFVGGSCVGSEDEDRHELESVNLGLFTENVVYVECRDAG